jgi:hypothetical protein
MVVLTVVRLRQGLGHPQRLNRVDHFGFYIPLALGEEYGRFVEEQLRHQQLEAEVMSCKVSERLSSGGTAFHRQAKRKVTAMRH